MAKVNPAFPDKNGPDPLAGFAPATRAWFAAAFPAPTTVQADTWAAIRAASRAGGCVLSIAPTGSGKTLAAFLYSIDRLFEERARDTATAGRAGQAKNRTRVLYVSPLKALGADVRKNLGLPLDGVAAERERRGDPKVELTVGLRTGDTPPAERAALLRRPPDILITTPESLYLMLTSKARESLRGVETVIVDEVHAVAGSKRGAHLALSLERLDELLPVPARRVGLSATVRPVERVAAFLGGTRPVSVVDPRNERRLDLRIVVPVEDMTDLPIPAGPAERVGRAGYIWFHVEASILERVLASRSSIVFVNSRGLAERLTARLNELYAERFPEASGSSSQVEPDEAAEPLHYLSTNGGTAGRSAGLPPLLARSHHGSVSKERRTEIEQALKSGELRCVVATSSLELGIDMGQVDLVIQVAAPPSVSSGLQRVGRSAHHVGGTPSGLIYPRTRRDLVDAAVTVESMLAGRLESMSPLSNPLDVLAQQTVAAVSMDPLPVDKWYSIVRRSDPFRALSRSAFEATLDMLAGRFPSDEFAEFRPRLVWDRVEGLLRPRPGAQRLAVINGGTIPDRGTFSVVLPEGEEQAGARRVGELDEEMVYESRLNDVITLGASSWRIQRITSDQVVVVPAPGRSARLPFWHGDGPGRPAELGEAIGAFLRAMDEPKEADASAGARLQAAGLDEKAAANLLNLLAEQRAATGALPTDRTLVLERCRDEVGDWRVMLHSPYGRRVHAPWGLAVAQRLRERFRVEASVVASDDGIVARIPDTEGRLPGAELFAFDADFLQRLITESVGTSALFAARFRECAARALLLPRRAPGRRSPLWQQRLRAGQLLEVAREHPDFPILIETARECLQDVYDLPALHGLMRRISAGAVRFVEATTQTPSPFAGNLLFGYVGEFMYEDDAPLAERRASLLALDIGLLSDLLGQADFGELLDPKVVERVAAELQHLAEERRVSGLEGVADLLRELGPLSIPEVAARLADSPEEAVSYVALKYLEELVSARRAVQVRIAAEERWAAVEDAARLRDGLGLTLPAGLPAVFLQPAEDPLRDLATRYARTHGPFTSGQFAARFGIGVAVADELLNRLREQGRLLRGDFGVRLVDSPAEQSEEGAESWLKSPGGPCDSDRPAREPHPNPLAGHEWLWEDVFRRLRARSLQAAREAARPVERAAYVRQLLERQFLCAANAAADPDRLADPGPKGKAEPAKPTGPVLRGADGVLRALEQLSGLALPASVWETQILPARVRDYAPGLLDELVASGEVVWSGAGRLGDNDGLVALHLAEFLTETRQPAVQDAQENLSELQRAILDVLADGGAYFARRIAELAALRQPSDQEGPALHNVPVSPRDLQAALWGLAWAGLVTTDTWSPLRALVASRAPRQAGRSRSLRRRINGTYRTFTFAAQNRKTETSAYAEPALAGRWSLLPGEQAPETARLLARAEVLLDRYGVVTRGTAMAENIPGGFPALQGVFRELENAGRILRGRFVKGLGAAQFADSPTINRLRELSEEAGRGSCLAMAAVDPANPYGAGLPWPVSPAKIRPVRQAGALVVVHDGELALWLARGGRNLLSFIDERAAQGVLRASVAALASALERGKAGSFTLEAVNDHPAAASVLEAHLREAGFSSTPKGLYWCRKHF